MTSKTNSIEGEGSSPVICSLRRQIEKWERFASQVALEVNCLPDYLNPHEDNSHIIDAIRKLKANVNVDSGLKALDVPQLVRASDSEDDSTGLGGTVDPVACPFLSFEFWVEFVERQCEDWELDVQVTGIHLRRCIAASLVRTLPQKSLPSCIQDRIRGYLDLIGTSQESCR